MRNWPTPYQIWGIVWPVVTLWIGLLAFAAYKDAHMPSGRGYDFVTVSLLVTVQFLLATVSLRLMKGFERFTIALAVFLTTKNIYWLWVLAFYIWPEYTTAHIDWLEPLRLAIVVTSIWALIEMVRIAGIGRAYDDD